MVSAVVGHCPVDGLVLAKNCIRPSNGNLDAPLALALAQAAPDRGAGAGCQQPGSPGWPQQDCRCAILVNVLAKSRRSFQPKGPG